MDFTNGRICAHRGILDLMLRILSDHMMVKLTDTTAYLKSQTEL